VIGGKLIAVLLQSISVVSAINPLVAFNDIHGGKREVLIFYFVPDTTRDSRTPHETRTPHDQDNVQGKVNRLQLTRKEFM
jgi:hypothetical protein